MSAMLLLSQMQIQYGLGKSKKGRIRDLLYGFHERQCNGYTIDRRLGKRMDKMHIVKCDITHIEVDAVVNAANEGLRAGGGVCGVIFDAAGFEELSRACNEIGHCDTGDAVITPGFGLRARYIIHAVGPIWRGGGYGEAKLLASCYEKAIELAVENGCASIAFPLISSGIYGYPKQDAWRVAIDTCRNKLDSLGGNAPEVVFCVISDEALALGSSMLAS